PDKAIDGCAVGQVKYHRVAGAEDTMRNRTEETILMIVRCAPVLAIVLGLIFALETVPAARAQVTIDVSKITCDQYTGNKVTNRQNIAIWLSGYYHGKRGETTVDTQQLGRYAKQVRDYCLFHPETLVMQAAETLIGPTK